MAIGLIVAIAPIVPDSIIISANQICGVIGQKTVNLSVMIL
ncbi:hypothetical protein [Merismopedia glauca]